MHFEALEPRLLMSADVLPLPVPAAVPLAGDRLLVNQTESAQDTLGALQTALVQGGSLGGSSAWLGSLDTDNFSSPLTALAPNGSFVHAGGVSGSIDTEFGVDELSLDVRGGQRVSLRLTNPDAGLQGRLQAWQVDAGGNQTLLGTVEAGQAGDALSLQVTSAFTGKLHVSVASLAGTGAYAVELFLGAALETTDSTGSGDAIVLGDLASALPGGGGSRASVIGSLSLGSSNTPIFVDRFDSIELDESHWSISTYGNATWGWYSTGVEPGYMLYSVSNGTDVDQSLTSAVLRVDLPTSDTDGLQLQFDQEGSDLSHEAFSGNAFHGDEYADGIAISVDNTLWVPVSDAMSGIYAGLEHHRLDLGAALADWGLQADGSLYIKFLHANTRKQMGTDESGNPAYSVGNRRWDNVVVDQQNATRWQSPVSVHDSGQVLAFGNLNALIDGVTPATSAPYSIVDGVLLDQQYDIGIDFDLGAEQRVIDLSLSLGAANAYLVQSSLDGQNWSDLLNIGLAVTVDEYGMQPVSTAFGEDGYVAGLGFAPTQARYLRVTMLAGGDGFGALGELQVRSGVDGSADGEDWYRLDLAAGESVSAAVALPAGVSGSDLAMALFDDVGNLLTFDNSPSSGATDASIANFRASADGAYYLRVAGNFSAEYHLAVTRNALLAGALGSAADITGVPSVASHVTGGGSMYNGKIRVAVQGDNGIVSAMLNDSTAFDIEAVAVSGSQIDTLAELSAYDVVLIGNHSYESEYDGFAPALRSWVEAGGGLVATGWTVFGGGLSTGSVVTDLDAVVPVNLNAYHRYIYSGLVQMTGVSHPVVDGIGDFQLPGMYSEYSDGGVDPGATTLATVNDNPTVVVADEQRGRSVYLGPTYFYYFDGSVDSGEDKLLEQAVAWAAGGSGQRFTVRAEAGDNLVIDAVLSGDANAAPVNTLVAALALLDAQGQVLATATGGSLNYTAAESGAYTIVLGGAEGAGDAVLRVSGSTASPDSVARVVSSSLDSFTRGSYYPGYVDLQFDSPLLLSSLAAGDLTINGMPAAEVQVLGAGSVRFFITPVDFTPRDGIYQLEIAEASIHDAAGRPLAGWSHSFTLDTTLPVVTASTLAQGAAVNGDPMLVHIEFSEALNAVNLGSEDVQLVNLDTGSTVALASFSVDVGGGGVQIGLPELPEGSYRLTLVAGGYSFRDLLNLPLNGAPSTTLPSGQGDNSGDDFALDFVVDRAPLALGELPALGAPGSLVYGKTVNGDLYIADSDDYTVQIDGDQLLSVAVDPSSAGGALQIRLEVLDADQAVVAQVDGVAGNGVLLQTLGAGGFLPAGQYTLRVSSLAGAGGYTLTALLGARVEAEAVAGAAANDGVSAAEDLSSAFLSFGGAGTRAAVVGLRTTAAGAESGDDYYRFTLAQGQQASAALAWASLASAGTLALDLLSADGTLLASSEAGVYVGGVQRIADFHADTSGDYLLRVRGSGNGQYSLLVTRSLSIDLPVSAADAALDISGTLQALGGLGGGGMGGSGGLGDALRVAVHRGTSSFVAALNDSTLANISAVSVVGSQLDTLGELQAYDVVIIGNEFYQEEFSLFDGALRTWVEGGGGIIATGWTVYGAGNSTPPARPDIDAIVPVNTTDWYGYNYAGTMVITDPTHDITAGTGSFTMPGIWSEYAGGGVDPGAAVLATINDQPTIVVGNPGAGRGVYFGTMLTEWNGTPTGTLDRLIEQAVLWAGGDRADDYLINTQAGDTLTIRTATPGDGAGQPVNTLDPRLELIDAAGNVIATDSNSAADGRNAVLTTTVTTGGVYKVRVRTEAGRGAYVVSVAGATGAPLSASPVVTAVTPANGAVLNNSPSSITFQLSEGVRADSVGMDDLVLDSGGTVTGVQLLAGNQVQFDVSIPLVEGAFAYHLVEGAFTDLQGQASAAFGSGFILDLGGARVTAVTPGADAGAPLSSWTFTFNEAIDPASASSADVAVFTGPGGQDLRGQIRAVSVNGNSLLVSVYDQFAPGSYHIGIGPDLRDLAGNAMDQDGDGVTGEAVEDRFVADTVLRSPDLTPTAITGPAAATLGSNISVTWTVRNAGNEAARGAWYDRIVLSTDATYDSGDTYLDQIYVSHNPLAADTSYTETRQINLPLDVNRPAGTYHLLLLTDFYGFQGEANENNNSVASAALELTVPPLPDLTVSDVTAPALVEAGKPVTISWTDNNVGNAATGGGWYDSIYLSSDNVLGDDLQLANVYYGNGTPIAPGGALPRSAQITIPINYTGDWYILVRGDNYNHINEYTGENNNHAFTASTTTAIVPTEDLVVASVTAADNGTFGQTINVAWTVANQGTGPSVGTWYDRVWLSRDDVYSNDDVFLGDFSAAGDTPLEVGASYQRSRDIALPLNASLGSGTYRVLVQTDHGGYEPESNEGNNLRASGAVSLVVPALPDLTVSGVSVPSGLRSGDSADIRFTLTNQGNAPASDFYYRLGLNDTPETANININLGDFRFNDTLSAGESVQITQRVTLPIANPGNWYLTVLADVYGQVYEHDMEANNGAVSTLLNLPLPPLVDLVVTDIAAPLDGIAGQQVPLTWTVKNNGTAAIVGGSFTDTLYLSTDGGASLDHYLGSFTFEGDLAAGASVMRSQSITLPPNVAGNYTVVVLTDNSGNWYEAGGEYNNRSSDNTRIATVLPPLPNLVVSSVTAPAEVFSSTQSELSWVVRNNGNGATSTPTWYDEVRLSLNTTWGDGDDVVLGTVANASYLDVGDSYVGHLTFNVPRGLTGEHYLLVRTDAYGYVFENNAEADNSAASEPMRINLTPPPDLTVPVVQAPAQAFSGQPMLLSWTVQNAGLGRTLEGAWYDRVFVSTDNVLDAGDLSLGQFYHSGALNAGAGYTQTQQVTLPIGQFGERWFFVVADVLNHVYEHAGEGNNAGLDATATQVLLTPPPDLEVDEITAPTSARAGAALNLRFSVRNFGATVTAESYWTDNVYLSTDATLDAGDLSLGAYGHYGALDPDASYSRALSVTLPNTLDGSYFVLVRTDAGNQVFEGFASPGYDPEGNNLLRSDAAIAIALQPADLAVTAIAAPATAEAGRPITVTWTDRNDGSGSVQAASWVDRVVVSSDAILGDEDDVQLGTLTQTTPLAVGESVSQTLQVTLPFSLASGNYWLYVQADSTGRVFEAAGEGNNLSAAHLLAVTRRTPDLVASDLTVALPASAAGRIGVGWRVDNFGDNRTDSTSWTDAVYLSRDATLGSGDLLLGTYFRGNPLENGDGYRVDTSFALPANLGSGDYYLIVRTDANGQVTEGADGEANNVALLGSAQTGPSPISVAPEIVPAALKSDLQVAEVDAPASGVSGQAISVSWTVANHGQDSTDTRDWYDAVYLSRDLVFDRSSDLYLGYQYHSGGLAAGASYNASGAFNVPQGQSGPFYVFVVADRGGYIAETVETNNAGFDSGFTQITLAPPADLVVGSITIPANAAPGALASVSYSVSNQGSNTALGQWRDTLYLSADESWDIGDAVFGSAQVYGPLSGGSSYSQTVTAALPGLTPGSYHVIVRSDILNSVAESDNGNNLSASLDAVHIDVAALTLGVAATGSLGAGQSAYYRLDVAEGETVSIALDSASSSAVNEVYVSFAAMPTRGSFDFSYGNPFAADQELLIPATRAGTYYVLLRSESVPEGSQSYNLTASTVPFGIRTLSQDVGGNAGQVTLSIEGARFDALTRLELIGHGQVRAPQYVRLVDPAHMVATFDLVGLPAGSYDLRAVSGQDLADVNPDTGEVFTLHTVHGDATLAAAFTVVEGGAARLTTHLSMPAVARANSVFGFYLEVANEGNNDAQAPLYLVSSPNGTPLTVAYESLLGSTAQEQVLVLGEYRARVLAPGERVTVPFLARAVDTRASQFELEDPSAPGTPLDWDGMESYYRDTSTDTEWRQTWSNFKAIVGGTWDSLQSAMRLAADELATDGQRTFTGTHLILDLLARARAGQTRIGAASGGGVPDLGLPGLVMPGTAPAPQSQLAARQGADAVVTPDDLIFDGDPLNWNYLQLKAAEDYLDAVAIPALTVKFGLTVGGMWYTYLHTNSTHPAARLTFGDGDAVVEGNAVAGGYKSASQTVAFVRKVMDLAQAEILRRLGDGSLSCDSLPASMSLVDLVDAKWLDSANDSGKSGIAGALNYSNPFDIPGNTAGGVGAWGALPFSASTFADSRKLSGSIVLKKNTDDCGMITSIDLESDFKITVDDALDFIPGDLGAGIEQVFTRPMRYLEENDWAGDVPFTVTYTPEKVTRSIPGANPALKDCKPEDPQPPAPCAPPSTDPCNPEGNVPPNPPDCDPPPPVEVPTVRPRDPNDITGPASFGDAHWIAAGDTLAYTIRFENAADASAPAQEVVVTQQLDADLDWRSFRVDDFGFGDQRIQQDGKAAFYGKRLDFSATRGFMLDVAASIDVSTGIVTWKLTTIDPATGEVPTDAQLGFLPPNHDADGVKDGRGEGFLSYTVKARRGVPTGTVIDATARIVFDTEEPIDTPAIFHTLDAGKPTSAVAALPATSEATEFTVTWSGVDAEGGSAIASYTVYVATDGGAFQTWLVDTTLTEAIYAGAAGHGYAFYSVARDNAGNVEAAPAEADAQTTIAAGKGSITGTVFDDSDGNGQRADGEAGLAGWTVYLDSNDNGTLDDGERVTATDGTGAYHFDNVLAGGVVVGRVLTNGWIGTAPSSGGQPVTVVADTTTDAVDFGAFLPGTAGGVVFDDVNANGQRDDGEALLGGISVQLDRNADGSVDGSTVTLGDGSWAFEGLLAGNYRITSALGDNRLATAPADGGWAFTVASGTQRSGLDFGSVAAARLDGVAYEDTDGDGQLDADESGLSGWTVFLDTNANGQLDAGERSTVSGNGGRWQFDALLPGSYTVTQLAQVGWLQTAPGGTGAQAVTSGTANLVYTGSGQALQLPDAWLAADLDLNAAGYSAQGSNRAAQTLIGLDALRADSRFSGVDGSGVSVVVIDTGIDVDNGFFGPDANGDGIADRIVYQYDFANDDADASDRSGHGSNVSSLIGAADGVYAGAYTGVAPGADLIALKVFQDSGKGTFSYLENALRWVVVHADEFNVGVVNLSLGDGGNWGSAIARFGIGDELAALATRNIVVTAAAGNNFAAFGGAWGVAYPAADPAVLAVGATWSANSGGPWAFNGGSTDFTTGADRIASFAQRDDTLLDVFAPGTGLVGANASGGLSTMQGSSQASAMMAGVAALAQDLALQTLGRRLSLTEFNALVSATSVHIVDGDDENDNVRNSGLTYNRIDVHALAEAILALPAPGGDSGSSAGSGGGTGSGAGGGTRPGSAAPAGYSVTLAAGQATTGLDFGNFQLGQAAGVVFEDANANHRQDGGEGGLGGFTVYLDANNNAALDSGEVSAVTDAGGRWQFGDLGPGTPTVRLVAREGWRSVDDNAPLSVTSGAHLTASLAANALPTLDAVPDASTDEGQTITVALAGHDQPGDTLHYSLVGGLTAGASIDADTGVLTWLAVDGEDAQHFIVRVTDAAGSTADRGFDVQVHNVAPALLATGAATVEENVDYVLSLSASDPGQDTLAQWTIDWGDGIVQTVAGNPSQAVHRYAQAGHYAVSASATDEDGTYSVAGPTVDVSAAVLQVASFAATDTGFAVRFNRAIDAATLNLYSAADHPMGASDIVFTDAAGQVVAGSVVVDADQRGLVFVRTGGLLAAGSYTVRLASGAQAFVDSAGGALDGNADGTRGDAYVRRIDVAGGGAVLAIGDLARGPGQEVNVPATGGGLPITLSNAAGATRIAFTLRYDASLIGFVGASNGAGLPAGSALSVDLSVAGEVRVVVETGAPLGAGTVELVRLQAGVLSAAAYGAREVLDLTDIAVNNGAIATRGDDGLHLVAYLGDGSGDQAYSALDVTRMQRVITRLDSGFGAFPLVDPTIIGDVNASGTLTSLDAARLQQRVAGLARPEFPPLPAAGSGFLEQYFAPASLTDSTHSVQTSGSAWISQWLAPAQSGNVAVKVKAGSSLIRLAPRLA